MYMQEIDLDTAARALEAGTFNFLRRGADLSLRMSGARWHLAERTPDTLTFRPGAPSASPSGPSPAGEEMPLALADVERITWDRLPRQEKRSQIRFHLRNGELWTFSGTVDPSLLA
jgi:hypothetical protein